MPDNIVTSTEIRRHGLAVIEARLANGSVRLMKRGRCVGVVLSEAEYEHLLQAQITVAPGKGALRWLLTQPIQGQRSREEIDAELQVGREW